MSRSDRTIDNDRPQNPAVRVFEWSGSKGQLRWYDKEEKAEHFVDLRFRFLVLDQLNTVKGFSDDLDTGFYANEVRRDGIYTLRTKNGIFQVGKWKDDLSHIPGAKFTKSVYIGFFNESDELVIGNLQLHGSALGELSKDAIQHNLKEAAKKGSNVEAYSDEVLKSVGWFGFAKSCPDLNDVAVELYAAVPDTKGANNFLRPVFRALPVSAETNEKAVVLDRQLQAYLKAYFEWQSGVTSGHKSEPEWSGEPDDPTVDAPYSPGEAPDDIPF
jgi:hypothetical protein